VFVIVYVRQIQDFGEQSGENNILTSESELGRRMENLCKEELHNLFSSRIKSMMRKSKRIK
jgi:hypothetical protein